ncbi:MAG: SusC/RagA family TonB-linked outer membrane protein, partial [Bacteroidales bacterium]
MKKIASFIVCLVFFGFNVILAQDVQISGNVTNADDGTALPGVSVIVQGTSVGTATDVDGNYSITVPPDAILVFSSVGMRTQEIAVAGQTVIDIALETEAVEVAEVVVTALGISREKKALGYSVQDVQGEELTEARESNVINAISGRVAGVQITGHGGGYGGSSRILVRGANSVTGQNQPLFIVDGIPFDNANYADADQERGAGGFDYGTMASDINPDDVESISILKGATAAALYGSRASNGVIVVTTKKGDKVAGAKKGLGISVNSGITFENVSILPDFQDEYGGGFIHTGEGTRDGFLTLDVDGVEYLIPDYAVDESWGPPLNGQQVAAWHNVYDYEQGITSTLETSPWSPQPDNIKDFFETGVTYRNNVALVGGTERTSFRMSYTNTNQSLVWPNGKIVKNNLSVSGNTQLSDKLKAFSTLTYSNQQAKGRPGTGYDGQNPTQAFWQWGQRQWDMEEMKNYRNPDGTMRTWNRISFTNPAPMYTDNPYWVRYMSYNEDQRNRLYGNVGLSYNLTDWLTATGKVMGDYYLDRREERIAVGSQDISKYVEGMREFNEMNYEFLLQFNKEILPQVNLIASFGGNKMVQTYGRNVGETAGGLSVPEFYNLANSISSATHDDYFEKKVINSLYGFTNFSYKDFVYLDLTLRNDWSSTLPEDNNSYLYPSVATSIVLSELTDLNWLSLAKIRASWAQVGNDTDPYDLVTGYRAKENFGSNPRYTVPNILLNENLKPEVTTSWEVGADLRFFSDRIGLDVTYYDNVTVDQIIQVDMSAASG